MSYHFNIVLTRWDPKAGERRNSPSMIIAESFDDAVTIAKHMARAAGEADPSRTYEIASVSKTGLNAIECEHGWMTYAEWASTIAEDEVES
ncbi:MAG: hypothetical protein AAFX78_02660 [Cyanobacteria bacterium J06638_20]